MVGSILTGAAALGNLGYNMYNTGNQNAASAAARRDMGKYINAYADEMGSLMNRQNIANNQSLLNYQNQLAELENEQNNLKYDFDKSAYDVNDYYDQNRAQQLGNTARTAQGTAALSGMGRSLGSAQGIAGAVADKDDALADKAYQRMQQDMSVDMSIADKNLSLAQSKLNQRLSNANSLFSAYQNNLDTEFGNQANLASSLLSANLSRASTI